MDFSFFVLLTSACSSKWSSVFLVTCYIWFP